MAIWGLTSSKTAISCVLIMSFNTYLTIRRQHLVNAAIPCTYLKVAIFGAWMLWITCSCCTFIPRRSKWQMLDGCFIGNFNEILVSFICILLLLHFVILFFVQIGTFYNLSILTHSLSRQVGPSFNLNTIIQRKRLVKMTRLSITVGVLCVITTVSWLPFVILLSGKSLVEIDTIISAKSVILSHHLVYLNSCLNIYIYLMRSNELRSAINQYLPKRSCFKLKSENSIIISSNETKTEIFTE